MRSFFQFIVIVVLILCGWFLYPVVAQFLRGRGCLPPEASVVAVVPVPPTQVVEETPKPKPPPEVTPDPGPETTGNPPPATGPVQRYKTLEEITDNWHNVPAKAFPKRVALKAELDLVTPDGNKMKMAEGREVVPLALNPAGLLTVSSAEGSDMKAVVDVDQTDFKERVTKRYNDGMEKIRAEAVARQESVRTRPATTEGTGEAPKPTPAGETPPPANDQEKNIALMKESVAAGAVEGLTPEKVKTWRWIGYEEIEGVGYTTGAAVFNKQTYFGEFETEAKALIRNGKVERWVLPGVGE